MITKLSRIIIVALFLSLIIMSMGIKARAEVIQEGLMMETEDLEVMTSHQLVLKEESADALFADSFIGLGNRLDQKDGLSLFIIIIPVVAILLSTGIVGIFKEISRWRRVLF